MLSSKKQKKKKGRKEWREKLYMANPNQLVEDP